MTVNETAMWIWTYGHFCGWDEATRYSTSFRENNILGELLPMLTVELMKKDLNIANPSHRSVIKSAIGLLFPDIEKKENSDLGLCSKGPKLECQQANKFCIAELEADCNSMMDFSSSANVMSESCNTRISSSLESCSSRSSRCVESCDSRSSSSLFVSPMKSSMIKDSQSRSRELVLRLHCEEQIYAGLIERLEDKFAQHNYDVEIERSNTKENSFIVKFKDQQTAESALAEAGAIGFQLSKSRRQRPSPDYLVRFKALYGLTVRKGKSLNMEKIADLKKNEVILVNQVKGRRARIVSVQSGKPVNFGWVSLQSIEGLKLLERIGDASE